MKHFLLIYISLLFISSPASAAQFFETLYDVPVMPGLVEVPELAINFDKIGGRISEAGAVPNTDMDKNKILNFYGESLPQMGWHSATATRDDEIAFIREGERLVISVEPLKAEKLVKFTLNPQ